VLGLLFSGIQLVSLLAFAYVVLHPILNTLSRMNKNLDEWEIGHKLAAESFGFRLTLWVMCTAWGLGVLLDLWWLDSTLKLTFQFYDLVWSLLVLSAFMTLASAAHMAWTIRPIIDENGLRAKESPKIVSARKQKVEATIILVVVFLILLLIIAGLFAYGWMSAHHEAGHQGLF